MRIISLDSVKGNEVLAKDIINMNDSLLMTAGTMVKKEYVNRLKDLGIQYIYVEDEIAKGVDLTDSLEIQIKDECVKVVQNIIQKYSYQDASELQEIRMVADTIISDVMSVPEVIYNLSSIRNKSESTYSHSVNVCALAVIIAIKLKLSNEKIREIAIGCLLHDIGFNYISLDVANITMDDCSESERKEIKKHIIYGYTAIEKMDWLSSVAKDIIIHHHERLDGSGYPFHLVNGKIKMGSRIAAVCDEFDSRAYGNLTKKMKVDHAIDYIVSKSGVLFDYSVVKAFVASVAAYPTGTMVITNDKEIGIVLRQNPKCPTRPVIRMLKDAKGKKIENWIEKDLTKELTLFISDSIME